MADEFLENIHPMNEEYAAWQVLCAELHKAHVDPNAEESSDLIKAIKVWGEKLSALRRGQDDEMVERAMREAES
jgi:hypothetical protein